MEPRLTKGESKGNDHGQGGDRDDSDRVKEETEGLKRVKTDRDK